MPRKISRNSETLIIHEQSFWAEASAFALAAVLFFSLALGDFSFGHLILVAVAVPALIWAGCYVPEGYVLEVDTTAQIFKLQTWQGLKKRVSNKSFALPLTDLRALTLEKGRRQTYRLTFSFPSQTIALTNSFTNSGAPQKIGREIHDWLNAKGHGCKLEN